MVYHEGYPKFQEIFHKLGKLEMLLLRADGEQDESLRKIEEKCHVEQPELSANEGQSCAKVIAVYTAETFGGKAYALCNTEDTWNITEVMLVGNSVQSEKLIAESGQMPQT